MSKPTRTGPVFPGSPPERPWAYTKGSHYRGGSYPWLFGWQEFPDAWGERLIGFTKFS